MSSDEDQPDYKVGYKKPPLHSRWKPGQSGHPQGSKPQPEDVAGFIDKHLSRKRKVKGENGRWVKMTNNEVIAIQEVNKAARGDHRATKAIKDHQRTRVRAKLDINAQDHEAVTAALGRLAEERAALASSELDEPPLETPALPDPASSQEPARETSKPEHPKPASPPWPAPLPKAETDDGWR